MVRFVDLEEDADLRAGPFGNLSHDLESAIEDSRPNPNLSQFSAALSCYPIVTLLARYIDLVTLENLSKTCRQIRANLLGYRANLISQTLRCDNENTNPAERLGNALHASHQVWTTYGRNGTKIGRITSGKIGACARDMVGECRKCGKIICRNCVIKTPPASVVKLRHRRLCRTCMKSPLGSLTTEIRAVDEDGNSTRQALIVHHDDDGDDLMTYESREFARDPCTCGDIVWICQPCGTAMRTTDTTYVRGWKWRTRYSHCGGMGAGLGEGNEGVECGRTKECLAARMVEKDVECDAEELAAMEAETAKTEFQGRNWNGNSYSTQEIVGIGGRMKTTVRKRVPVGAIVKEYEDERMTEDFLGREQSGQNRSWCSWCSRVVVGKKDLDGITRSTESISSSSSAEMA
ncbi:uncharacterized protein MYCFIDRAFT_38772 [Pseudocercospora fijiensis CIRAD86]|uniref:Uncharacterized protein n=1 Tax=Pseudocercospora fijiensis (strain CIRAD86) TaxID=383855 RepID=M3AG24_PSEFD|nr:uncharacterized protein MYCFIDRAFT_38772 [Pseudocercospora fijiensis CIRAD86]EME83541.1 hypothetical protein MYCFIDRAFT_38772 [Pseudocercospora fijiensis CIRAD86]